jgi:hypothetical protein
MVPALLQRSLKILSVMAIGVSIAFALLLARTGSRRAFCCSGQD